MNIIKKSSLVHPGSTPNELHAPAHGSHPGTPNEIMKAKGSNRAQGAKDTPNDLSKEFGKDGNGKSYRDTL